MTVRFPSGFSIQYNSATQVIRHAEYTDLYTKHPDKGGSWLAQVPNNCVVEAVIPCRTYNPISQGAETVATQVADLTRKVTSLSRKLRKIGTAQ